MHLDAIGRYTSRTTVEIVLLYVYTIDRDVGELGREDQLGQSSVLQEENLAISENSPDKGF